MEPVDDADHSGFEDYSLSTEIERLTFAIEQAAEKWFSALISSKRLSDRIDEEVHPTTNSVEVIKHNFPFRKDPYVLKLHLAATTCLPSRVAPHEMPPAEADAMTEASASSSSISQTVHHAQWPYTEIVQHARFDGSDHNIQRWFGVDTFMTLSPLQGTRNRSVGRSEACTLRSAAACALSNIFSILQCNTSDVLSEAGSAAASALQACLASTPLFVPVYGPEDGFWLGVACVGSSHVFFETEHEASASHFSLSLQPLIQVMAKSLVSADPMAAAICTELDQRIEQRSKVVPLGLGPLKGSGTACLAGTTIAASRHAVFELQTRDSSIIHGHTALQLLSAVQAPWMNGFTPHAYHQACATPEAWDLHAAWRPWAELPDPISSIRLQLTWRMVPVRAFMKQSKFEAMSADEWVVRAFSRHLQEISTAELAFEAGSEENLCSYKPLDLQRPHRFRLAATAQNKQKHGTDQKVHATFSHQLKAFIPVVVILVTEASWDGVRSSRWWQIRGARRPHVPPEESLYAISHDALSGECPSMHGISASVSGTKFLNHVVASFVNFIKADSASTSDGQDALPPWAGAHALATPLGVLSLHMMKLDCPSAVARLWNVFVRTVAVDFCENLAPFRTNWDTKGNSSTLRQFGAADLDSSHSTPHALWLQYLNDHIADMVKANDFMDWALAEANWEAAELGIPSPSNAETLATIEEDQIGEMRESHIIGEGVKSSCDIGPAIQQMLWMLTSSTCSAKPVCKAASRLNTDGSSLGGTTTHEAYTAANDTLGRRLTQGEYSNDTHAGYPCQERQEVPAEAGCAGVIHAREDVQATAETSEMTHEQLVHQEARQRLHSAMSQMFHQSHVENGGMSNEQNSPIIAEHVPHVSHQLEHPASTPSTVRVWSPQKVQQVRQTTSQLLSIAEGNLQCLVDCLKQSSPGPVVIGAFLCSCQAALVSLLSCQGAQMPRVKQLIECSWKSCAHLSGQIWEHIGGQALHSDCLSRASQGQQHVPLSAPKLQKPQLAKLIDFLTAMVSEIEYVENVVAAAESVTRRLHACPEAACDLINASLGEVPAESCRHPQKDAQDAHSTAGAATVQSMHERSMISQIMTLDWRSLAKQSGSCLPPRMWSDHMYDTLLGLHRRPSPKEMRSAREALDERVRNQWCNQTLEELALVCQQQAGASAHQQPRKGYPPHRIYVRKKGNSVRTATAIIHGHSWHEVSE